MGIQGLLAELPCWSETGFERLEELKDGNEKGEIDTGILIYVCALMHREAYNAGDCIPAVREFQHLLVILTNIHKWRYTLIFDGIPPPEKEHEHRRRREKENSIAITSNYILMCIEVCKRRFIPYVVAPVEADSQVCRHDKPANAVCRDSDELAYGLLKVVIVDSYFKETYRYFDLTLPVTEEIKKKYPLYYYYHQYGVKLFHWWAAVMGCNR